MQENAFADMIGEKIAEQTFSELTADDQTASPEELRHAANNLCAKGESDCPYDLEHLSLICGKVANYNGYECMV
jgi:hypothetical protein